MKICSFEGCGKKHEAKGLCGAHYRQHQQGQELKPLRQYLPGVCSFEGCGRVSKANGLCPTHRRQQRKGNELRPLKADLPKVCSFDGCGRNSYAKGLCAGHYQQKAKGKELRPLRQDVPVEDLFMNSVEKTDTCWLWTGTKNIDGYGKFGSSGYNTVAHRVSYDLFVGPVGKTDVVHHTCHVRNCVNPEHLQAVTQAQNVAESLDRQHLLSRITELEARVAELELEKLERLWNLT